MALHANNRTAMLTALKELHPKIAVSVEAAVHAADDAGKARALFTGMFERKQNNVQKGRFGQALAHYATRLDLWDCQRSFMHHALPGAYGM